MCLPAVAAMTAMQQLMLASTVLSAAGSIHGAREQKKAHVENAEAANEAKVQEDMQISNMSARNQQDAASAKIQSDASAQKAASRAKVAAGESGGSLNNDAVVNDIMRQGLVSNNQTSTNLSRLDQDTQYQYQGSASRAQSRINSVAAPSYAATGLQVGSTVASGYAANKQAGIDYPQTPKPPKTG